MHNPVNYTNPDWMPLERAIGAVGLPREVCEEFMWMFEDPAEVHHYKHRATRRYVMLNFHDVWEANLTSRVGGLHRAIAYARGVDGIIHVDANCIEQLGCSPGGHHA